MLTLEQPDNIFSALRMSPAAFVREMRVAAAEEKGVASPLTREITFDKTDPNFRRVMERYEQAGIPTYPH